MNPPVATFILFKMVNVMKGVLIECDPAMKQFLLHLDEKVSLMGAYALFPPPPKNSLDIYKTNFIFINISVNLRLIFRAQ